MYRLFLFTFLFGNAVNGIAQRDSVAMKPILNPILDTLVTDTTRAPLPKDTTTHVDTKLAKDFNKTLKVLSYLNYRQGSDPQPSISPKKYLQYKGKQIKNIEIQVLYPYGVSVESPLDYHPTKLQRGANSIHIRTRKWAIYNDLLFREGEKLDPTTISDTERNLWKKNIYKDIDIQVVDTADSEVNVKIIVRDRWNWSINSIIVTDKVTAGLQFNNILGLPQIFNFDVAGNFTKAKPYTIGLAYQYSNIYGSFIDAGIRASFDRLVTSMDITVARSFYTANTEWAGHVKINFTRQSMNYGYYESKLIVAPTKSNKEDIWMAKSFKLNGRWGERIPLLKFIAAVRMVRNAYSERPYIHNVDNTVNFINQTYLLGSIGLAKWEFYIDHNVYQLGKAEYFVKGLSVAGIAGFQQDEELSRRTYLALAAQYGKYFNSAGYLLSQLKMGGFASVEGINENVLEFKNTFYTVPFFIKKVPVRQFFTTITRWGFNQPIGRDLIVNNLTGLRGILATAIRGDQAYSIDYEFNIYNPSKVLGFSNSYFLFADVAMTQRKFTNNEFQTAIGVGLRLRNINLGLDFLELSIAYYPMLHIAEQPQYNLLGGTRNERIPERRDLFTPNILTVD